MRETVEVIGSFSIFRIEFMSGLVSEIALQGEDGKTISIVPPVLNPRELGHVLTMLNAYAYDSELDVSFSPCDYDEDEQSDLIYQLCVEILNRQCMLKVSKNLLLTLKLTRSKYDELVDVGGDFFIDVAGF